jgi:hypothetical protein
MEQVRGDSGVRQHPLYRRGVDAAQDGADDLDRVPSRRGGAGARVPFRTFPATCWPFFSWPRYSLSSWFSAISSTVLVSCFSSPSAGQRQALLPGPPHQLLRRLLLGRQLRPGFFVTSSSVTFITAPLPLNTRLSDQCRKHRCQDSLENPSERSHDHGGRHSQFRVCMGMARCSVTCALSDRTHNMCSQVVPNPAGRPMARMSTGGVDTGDKSPGLQRLGAANPQVRASAGADHPSLPGSNAK